MLSKTQSLQEGRIDQQFDKLQKRLSLISIDDAKHQGRRSSLNLTTSNYEKKRFVGRLSRE